MEGIQEDGVEESADERQKRLQMEYLSKVMHMQSKTKRKEELIALNQKMKLEDTGDMSWWNEKKVKKKITQEEREQLNEFLNLVNKDLHYPKDTINNIILSKVTQIKSLYDSETGGSDLINLAEIHKAIK